MTEQLHVQSLQLPPLLLFLHHGQHGQVVYLPPVPPMSNILAVHSLWTIKDAETLNSKCKLHVQLIYLLPWYWWAFNGICSTTKFMYHSFKSSSSIESKGRIGRFYNSSNARPAPNATLWLLFLCCFTPLLRGRICSSINQHSLQQSTRRDQP